MITNRKVRTDDTEKSIFHDSTTVSWSARADSGLVTVSRDLKGHQRHPRRAGLGDELTSFATIACKMTRPSNAEVQHAGTCFKPGNELRWDGIRTQNHAIGGSQKRDSMFEKVSGPTSENKSPVAHPGTRIRGRREVHVSSATIGAAWRKAVGLNRSPKVRMCRVEQNQVGALSGTDVAVASIYVRPCLARTWSPDPNCSNSNRFFWMLCQLPDAPLQQML